MTPQSPPTTGQPIIRVAIPTPLRQLFDYLPPAPPSPTANVGIPAGARVSVPFGARTVIGIVVETADKSGHPPEKLRRIHRVIDRSPCLPASLFDCLVWAADYYQHPLGDVLTTAIPLHLRQGKPLVAEQVVWRTNLSGSLDDALETLGKAHRQKQLLEFIASHDPVSLAALTQRGFNPPLLKKLESAGLVTRADASKSHNPAEPAPANFCARPPEHPLNLNAEQAAALKAIESRPGYSCVLLNGITGSGKTEVYIRAMEAHLQSGRQCLVLVPEIGLTPQTVRRFENRFACPVVTLHSNLSDGDRLKAWRQAYAGEAGIIIGTRSAVFTPMKNPGLIVVDEEHDSSFKQHDGFRYSARDFAIKRAQADNIPIILGSATPSLESLRNSIASKYRHIQLKQRAGAASKAPMQLIDTTAYNLEHGFTELLLLKIEQHLTAKNQVLIFINRRGFAPMLHCPDCGWTAECDNCVSRLTVHSLPPTLRCHHCDTSLPIPRACPTCHSTGLQTQGVGTQKIEQFLQQRFPGQSIVRIDRDSTRNRKDWQNLTAKIQSGKPTILLGTQMLAKGHHFPGVTLVGILDADIGLFSADFRGQEQMAQIIVQVAGRAGRADKPGEVYLQTRHSGHPALQGLRNLPYTEIAMMLLQERQAAAMPPYTRLALLHIEGQSIPATISLAQQINQTAREIADASIDLLGPVPAPMEKRAGKYRLQLMAKSAQHRNLQQFLHQLCLQLDQSKIPSGARWSLDVDPMDLI